MPELTLAQDADADAVLSANPLALLIGMLLDQQFPMERAFASPALLTERLGGPLTAAGIATYDTEALVAALTGPPALHRYRLHDLVRAVGRERVAPGAAPAVAARVRACYLAMLWRADELDGGGTLSAGWRDPAWAAPARDLDDLEEVLEWLDADRATLVRLVRSGPADFAVAAAVGMNLFGPARKRWLEWRDVNLAAADLVDGDPVAAAMVHFDLGLAYGELEDFAAAARHLARATAAARAMDPPSFLVRCLVNEAHMLERAGRTGEGFAVVAEALELADDPETSLFGTLTLGMLHGKAGALEQQAAVLARAIALAADAPPEVRARVLAAAGASLREAGQAAEAVPVLAECAALRHGHDPSGGEAEALDELAAASRQLGRPAVDLYLAALRVAQGHDLWDREVSIRTGLGHAYADLGRTADAREQWALADRVRAAHGMPVTVPAPTGQAAPDRP